MLILLLVPCVLGASGVRINITPGTNSKEPSVLFYGESYWALTVRDQQAFHITYGEVAEKSYVIRGFVAKKPFEVSESITVTMKATSAQTLDHKKENVTVASKDLHNGFLRESNFKAEFNEHVSETISGQWNWCPALGDQNMITLDFDNGRMSRVFKWGEDIHETYRTMLSKHSEVAVVLLPEEQAKVELRSIKASIRIKIDYEATVHGTVCMKYFWLLLGPETVCGDIQQFLLGIYKPYIIKTSQVVTIEYYYGTEVKVLDDGLNNCEEGYDQGC